MLYFIWFKIIISLIKLKIQKMNTNVKQASLLEEAKQLSVFSVNELGKMDEDGVRLKTLNRLEELGIDPMEYNSPLLVKNFSDKKEK